MKMLKLMKGLVRYLILMVIFSITQVVCELYLPSIMSNVVDIGISSANTDYIFSESFKMIIIAVVGLISNIFVVYAASKFSNQYGYNIRKALYNKIYWPFSWSIFFILSYFLTLVLFNKKTLYITFI